MLYVVIEMPYNIINPIANEFIARYHKSSVRRIGKGDDLSAFVRPPLFNSEWLILCSSVTGRMLKRLYPDRNTVIWQIPNKRFLHSVIETADGYEYQVIDNSKLPREIVVQWIGKRLSVPNDMAAYIYRRTKGSLKLIIEGVARLECVSGISRSIVNQYVDKANFIGIYSIVEYLLGISVNVEYGDVVSFFYVYRGALDWLKRSLVEELQFYLHIFIASDSGEVNLSNVPEFITDAQQASLRAAKPYRVTKVLRHHSVVSTELVYSLILELEALPNSLCGMERLLRLVRAGGNNVYFM